MRGTFVTACVTCVCLSTAAAAPPAGKPQREPLAVRITAVTGEAVRGRLVSFDLTEGLVMSIADGTTYTAPAADLIRLDREPPPPAAPTADARTILTFELINGDRVRGTLSGADGETLAIAHSAFDPAMHVDLADVGAILSPRADEPVWRERVHAFSAAPPTDDDRVLLSNGDTVRGLLVAVDPEGIEIEVDDAPRRLQLADIVAVRLVVAAPPIDDRLRATLVFDDGMVVTVHQLLWNRDAGLRVREGGAPLNVDAERLRLIAMAGGRWVRLEELTPISFEYTPMLSTNWPYQVNQNVLGKPLAAGDETFEHGIGVHSRTLLRYELAGAYAEFVTRFGLDRSAGPYAAVDVAVRVDGATVLTESIAYPSVLSGPHRFSIEGSRTLELLVDFGANGSMQDRFNWIEPGLVRR